MNVLKRADRGAVPAFSHGMLSVAARRTISAVMRFWDTPPLEYSGEQEKEIPPPERPDGGMFVMK